MIWFRLRRLSVPQQKMFSRKLEAQKFLSLLYTLETCAYGDNMLRKHKIAQIGILRRRHNLTYGHIFNLWPQFSRQLFIFYACGQNNLFLVSNLFFAPPAHKNKFGTGVKNFCGSFLEVAKNFGHLFDLAFPRLKIEIVLEIKPTIFRIVLKRKSCSGEMGSARRFCNTYMENTKPVCLEKIADQKKMGIWSAYGSNRRRRQFVFINGHFHDMKMLNAFNSRNVLNFVLNGVNILNIRKRSKVNWDKMKS